MSTPGIGFGHSLRRERERRGITLEAVVEETKVSATLLAGLEDDDLSRWPSGIFRRGFVKAYAEAIGLDATIVVADFLRHFPDQVSVGASQLILPDIPAPSATDLRLTFEQTGPAATLKQVLPGVPARAMAIAVDIALLVVMAGAAGLMWGLTVFWIILGSMSVLSQVVIAFRPELSPGNRLFDCVPRSSSAGAIEEEFPIQASLQFSQEWSERIRQDRRESSPDN